MSAILYLAELNRRKDTTLDKRCGNCARGCYRRDIHAIACGAPVDEDAIMGRAGVNPIWAERKYSMTKIGGLAAAIRRAQNGLPPDQEADDKALAETSGSDCDCMNPADGAQCKMWQSHPDLAGDDEAWHDMTMLGSQYEEQISETGKRRHRPLRLSIEPREFGEERGVGDWRPGAPS